MSTSPRRTPAWLFYGILGAHSLKHSPGRGRVRVWHAPVPSLTLALVNNIYTIGRALLLLQPTASIPWADDMVAAATTMLSVRHATRARCTSHVHALPACTPSAVRGGSRCWRPPPLARIINAGTGARSGQTVLRVLFRDSGTTAQSEAGPCLRAKFRSVAIAQARVPPGPGNLLAPRRRHAQGGGGREWCASRWLRRRRCLCQRLQAALPLSDCGTRRACWGGAAVAQTDMPQSGWLNTQRAGLCGVAGWQ